MQLSDYEQKAIEKFYQTVTDGKWSNDGIVQLIEVAGAVLNIATVPDYAKKMGISDRAARNDTNNRKNRNIFNVNFVIDNE